MRYLKRERCTGGPVEYCRWSCRLHPAAAQVVAATVRSPAAPTSPEPAPKPEHWCHVLRLLAQPCP